MPFATAAMVEATRPTAILFGIFVIFTTTLGQTGTGETPGDNGGDIKRTSDHTNSTTQEDNGDLQSDKIRGTLEVTEYSNNTSKVDFYTGQVAKLYLTIDFTDQQEATETKVAIALSSTTNPILGFLSYLPVIGEGLTASNPLFEVQRLTYYDVNEKKQVGYYTIFFKDFGTISHVTSNNSGVKNTEEQIIEENGGPSIGEKNNGEQNNLERSDFHILLYFEIACYGENLSAKGENFDTTATIETTNLNITLRKTFVYQGLKAIDEEPSFNVEKVTEIEVLKPLTVKLDMFLPNPLNYVEITVDASQASLGVEGKYALHNQEPSADDQTTALDTATATDSYDGVLVQDIKCAGSGKAFGMSLNRHYVKVFGYDTCPLKHILSLEVASLVNTESQKENPKHEEYLMSFNITVVITDPMINRSHVAMGIAVNVNNKTMWASEHRLAVIDPERAASQDRLLRLYLSLESNQAERLAMHMNVSSGSRRSFTLQLETPPISNQTYQVTMTTFSDVLGTANALRILAVVPEDTGSNLVCQPNSPVQLVNRSEEGPSMWSYSYKVRVFNLGVHTDEMANTMKLGVTVVMLGNAMEGDIYTLSSTVDDIGGPIFSFAVDAPAKAYFNMSTPWGTLPYGHPGFASLVLHTPPGISQVYDITLLAGDGPDGEFTHHTTGTPMSILAVNLLRTGSNVASSIRPTDLALNLTSSTNSSVMDRASFRLNVSNTGDDMKDDADDVEIEIVFVLFGSLNTYPPQNMLQVAINEIGVKRITISAYPIFPQYDDSILSTSQRPGQCPGNIFSYGSVVRLLLEIVTHPETTAGPLEIQLLQSRFFTFQNASVTAKGRNVACVNIGHITTTPQIVSIADRIIIGIPMVCNRQRFSVFGSDTDPKSDTDHKSDTDTESDTDDAFYVDIAIEFKDKEEFETGSADQNVYVEVLSDITHTSLEYPVNLVNWEDLGQIKVVEKVHLVDPQNRGEFILEWSMDGVENIKTALTGHTDARGEAYLLPDQFPVFARYFRVLRREDACFVNVSLTTTDDLPFVHGPTDKTGKLLTKMLRRVTDSKHPVFMPFCTPLPKPGDIETTPYLWIDFKTAPFRVDISSGMFKVLLVGNGIQCNSRIGPQITMVVIPKERPARNGEKLHQLCEVVNHNMYPTGRRVCMYKCVCDTDDECKQMTLLMMNTQKSQVDTDTEQDNMDTDEAGMASSGKEEQYSLCQFHIWKY